MLKSKYHSTNLEWQEEDNFAKVPLLFRAEKRNKHARTFTGGLAQGLKEMAEIRFSVFQKVGMLPRLHQ